MYELGVKDQGDSLGSKKGMEGGDRSSRATAMHMSPRAATPVILGGSNCPASRGSSPCHTVSPASCRSPEGPQEYPASWPGTSSQGGASQQAQAVSLASWYPEHETFSPHPAA